MTTSKLYNDVCPTSFCFGVLNHFSVLRYELLVVLLEVKLHKDLVHFETAYVVKLHNVARLAPCKPVSYPSRCHAYPNPMKSFRSMYNNLFAFWRFEL